MPAPDRLGDRREVANYLPMSMPTREELLWRFPPVNDDPELLARRQHIIDFLLETSPQTRQRLIDKELMEGRRWLDRAVTAVGVSDALE